MKVSVIGTTGYGGGELLRLLKYHPAFNIHSIHSSRGNHSIMSEFPHLTEIYEQDLQLIDPNKIAQEADIVFLATPSGVSGELVEAFADKNIQLIDLSGDLRLKDSGVYKEWYKHNPVKENVVAKAVYGLSEWNQENIKNAELIANPGCYPTASLLALGPIVTAGLINPSRIIIDAKSGVSGAGRSPSKGVIFSEVNENFKIYKVNEHQHIPEIEQQLLQWNSEIQPITFSTHLLPITRGIMATIYVELAQDQNPANLIELYKEAYRNHPFVRVREYGTFPAIKEVLGSNYCDIGLKADPRTGRLTIVSVIDNLVKGAAGQAIQNANLMNGIEETAGLSFVPLYP